MAEEKGNLNTSKTSTFIKGLHKDGDPAFIQEGMWTYARNAVNNTIEGDVGTISNEVSNALCATAGATIPNTFPFRYIIGMIHLYTDKWVVFTASHATETSIYPGVSEIGLFEELTCTYRPIVQDACLAFSKSHLISGASRERENCSWQVYWADGLNPDRYLNVGDPKTWPGPDYNWLGGGASSMNFYSNGTVTDFLWPGVPWKEVPKQIGDCEFTKYLNVLDCNKTRLARLMSTPCLNLTLGDGAGSLENGSYYAVIAYLIRGEKVTDYFSASNVQPVYTVNTAQGSLILNVSADSENFDEFQLVLVANINENTIARIIGNYSTKTQRIFIDQYKPSLESIDITLIPIVTPVFEKSDQIAQVNNYLLRVGPTTKFDFNYQPLANLIEAEWVSVEYPANYYFKGGSNTNYMRDEVYSFFIRWVYDTGDKSASYHIPGRAPLQWGPNNIYEDQVYSNSDSFPGDTKLFQTINTARQNPPFAPYTLDDGGVVIAAGKMSYWQSTEVYPDNRPDIWNSSYYTWTGKYNNPSTDYDLCGVNIRHHKFPENVIYNAATGTLSPSTSAYHFRKDVTTGALYIRTMSVRFNNIIFPKDNEGIDIPGIVGYEILRGSRDGNRSIIAKGMLNNFRTYNRVGVPGNTRTGLYANYPYNTIIPIGNDTTGHDQYYNDPYIKSVDTNNNVVNQGVPINITSFHSPDTSFRTPYLAAGELKIYGHLSGEAIQRFIEPQGHPKFKLMSNDALWIILIAGIADALLRSLGKKQINYPQGGFTGQYDSLWAVTGGVGANFIPPNLPIWPTGAALPNNTGPQIGMGVANTTFQAQFQGYNSLGGFLVDAFAGTDLLQVPFITHNNQALLSGATYNPINYTTDLSGYAMLPTWAQIAMNAVGGVAQIAFFFLEGAVTAQELLYAIGPYRQYALQLIGHGLYDTFNPFDITDTKRFRVADASYVFKNISFEIDDYTDTLTGNLSQKYTINNYKRSQMLMLRTERANAAITDGPKLLVNGITGLDQSLGTLGMFDDWLGPDGPKINEKKKSIEFSTPIASHYSALKVDNDDQYGQLRSITQLVVTPCEQKFVYDDLPDTTFTVQTSISPPIFKSVTQRIISQSPVIFGGDTYITRFTEKNPMFFFYNWLYTEPNGYEYNYFNSQMIPEPRFWANSERYDLSQLQVTNLASWAALFNNSTTGTGFLPNDYFNLDNDNYVRNNDTIPAGYPGFIYPKNSYFYLSASGVRDFFVESDVINDFREVGVFDYEKCYNPYRYTDLETMFRMDKITPTEGNFYLYDYSLSITRLTNRYTSFGFLQSVYYDPDVAELCYTYYPNTITYSLPVSQTSSTDGWFVFLPLNRKDFISQISGVKNFAKTGAFVTFKNDSPIVFQGVDTLEMDGSGTKVIIGDGGLFARDPQNLVVADKPYMYGSSQGRLSVISTPAGLYYISQDQGKVFSYGEGLQEISQAGMKWWFDFFLPSKLLEDFPDYPYIDNPVAGVGTQAVYDNYNSVLYFCKKDYKLKEIGPDGFPLAGRVFNINTVKESYFNYYPYVDGKPSDTPVKLALGDSRIFEDASWTVSYDPKSQFWISFHDWHPDLVLPTKDSFITTKTNKFYKHGINCGDYCNFYGVQYPFEIEFPITTGQTVTTVKSIEYVLECYRREKRLCMDQFHVLDYNFDRLVIHNTEQISGYLNLNIFPKNNIALSLQYPQLNISNNAFDILFSKEENKYRVNQFWDITKDRGEFPNGAGYPPQGPLIPGTTTLLGNYPENILWMTEANGYKKAINPLAVDYNKSLLQRKKFRHMVNFMYLSKADSRDTNMILKLFNSKNQYSLR